MTRSAAGLDPVTLEILGNRLWITNDEIAATVRRVSGSPVATEACDFNTALLLASGDALTIGTYMLLISTGFDHIVKDILANLSENPGIEPDDMFLCSDPYRGTLHQSDVALVAPVHWEGELVAWSGVAIHEIDVGGLVYGSHGSIGATSIYQEGLPIPPIKLIERGLLRKDLEQEYLIRSRTPDLNKLDLRAKIAANILGKQRIRECFERYGAETVKAGMDAIVDANEELLRHRLNRVPDGVWRHRAYLDGLPGDLHELELEVRKEGTRLVFDLTRCGPQAPAVFNATRPGTVGGVIAAVLPTLCYGTQWCPAAVNRVVEVVTTPGTIVHPEWPAGVCKASTSCIPMVNTMSAICLGRMLAASDDPELSERAMAAWMVAATVQDLHGTDQRGQSFAATMLDPMAGGGGAHADSDGIDSGGIIRAVKLRIANVETYEFRYPLLYLHRRQEPDSAGAGIHRGGVGCSLMYTPHGTDEIPGNVMHSINTQAPTSLGIMGGHPAGTNMMMILRDSDVWDQLDAGQLPTELDALAGELEVIPGMATSNLRRGDVYRTLTCGGGGFGDPLWRDPADVATDVRQRTVSPAQAAARYGVALRADGAADESATRELRERMLHERRAGAAPAPAPATGVAGAEPIRALGPTVRIYEHDGAHYTGCACGTLWAGVEGAYKDGLALLERPVQDAGPYANPHRIGEAMVFRRFLCPGCARVVECEIARPGTPVLDDVVVSAGQFATVTT